MSDRWASFDCYGTLIDWRTGMLDALRRVAPADAEDLLDAYHPHEAAIERGPFVPYGTVLSRATLHAAGTVGVEIPPGEEDVLARTLPAWPQFDDVPEALAGLVAGGWRLAILSNVDRDLIAGTLERLPVAFDLVVTAEDVRSYKPQRAHFQRLLDETGVRPSHWAHVACSAYHDIPPASELGAATVWIDRDGTGGNPAGATVRRRDLVGLARLLDTVSV